MRLITGLFSFTSFTVFFFLGFIPFPKVLTLVIRSYPHLMVPLYIQTMLSLFLPVLLSMGSKYNIFSLISFVALEFKVLGVAFQQTFDHVSSDLQEKEFNTALDDFKENVKQYQRLLR